MTRAVKTPSRGDPVYIAKDSGAAEIDGQPMIFVKGKTLVREGHPLLTAVPDSFQLVDDAVHYDVEATSAAPGEVRGEE